MKPLAVTFLLLCASGFANAQTTVQNGQTGSIDAQRAEISARRSRLEAGFLAEETACYEKFAVNNCLEKANARLRDAMAELRRQEILLNDEERKTKGAQQLRKTEEKSSPEKLKQDADRRTKAVQDYQSRLEHEKDKQQVHNAAVENETAARQANTARLQAHQQKNQVRIEQKAEAVEKAKEFEARQSEAQERRGQA